MKRQHRDETVARGVHEVMGVFFYVHFFFNGNTKASLYAN